MASETTDGPHVSPLLFQSEMINADACAIGLVMSLLLATFEHSERLVLAYCCFALLSKFIDILARSTLAGVERVGPIGRSIERTNVIRVIYVFPTGEDPTYDAIMTPSEALAYY